jgi:hypothetical protein
MGQIHNAIGQLLYSNGIFLIKIPLGYSSVFSVCTCNDEALLNCPTLSDVFGTADCSFIRENEEGLKFQMGR